MTGGYRPAILLAVLAVAAVAGGLTTGDGGPLLVLAGAGLPGAVALALAVRTGTPVAMPAMIGGAVVGAAVALVGHGIVFAFAAAFILGFADEARALLDAVRIDPRLTTVLASPWILVALADLAVVAPITEETGKALGARWVRPGSAGDAFMAGVAAGAGFAVLENVLYAVAGGWFGDPWTAVLLARLPGAAVHPLASGLVMLGWWWWRHGADRRRGLRLILGGVGVHALWNGSLVALLITEIAFAESSAPQTYALVTQVHVTALGAVAAAGAWWIAGRTERPARAGRGLGDGRTLGAWVILSASLLVPMAMLLLAFPGFYLG